MKYRYYLFIILLITLIIYVIKGIYFLDSDFGWHIRLGQIILQKGIPSTEPFSYAMPSYPFVDHEWLTNVIIATLYPLIGMAGLSFTATLCVLSALLLQIPWNKYRMAILPLILICTALFSIIGVRTQILSWLFFSILLNLLNISFSRPRYSFGLIVLLIWIWSNLHGSFPIGLVILGLFILLRWITIKKIKKLDIYLLLTCFMVTIINPYGYRLWWEVWMQISDHSLRWSIVEWMPAFMFINISLWTYVVVSTMLVYRYRRHLSLFEKTVYILLLCAGISTFRHMPFWIIFSLAPTLMSMQLFYEEIKKIPYSEQRLILFYKFMIGFALFCSIWEVGWYSYSTKFVNQKKYPEKAVAYLKKNIPQGEIFTIYEWGGYLDWKLPEKKVFIDGRMPSFRWHAPNQKESDYAMQDYRKILYDKKPSVDKLIKKHNIKTLLLRQKRPRQSDSISIWLEQFISRFVPISKQPTVKSPLLEHTKILYSDDVSVLYTIIK